MLVWFRSDLWPLWSLEPVWFSWFWVSKGLQGHCIITAKLSQKSKQKLQLLAEMVIISTNPTTYPTIHPDKYEGYKIEQNLENKSCLSIWLGPKNVFGPCPKPKNGPIRANSLTILCLRVCDLWLVKFIQTSLIWSSRHCLIHFMTWVLWQVCIFANIHIHQ